MRRRLPCQPHHSHHRLTYQAHPGDSLCSGDSLAIHDLSWDSWVNLGPSCTSHIDGVLRGKSGFWFDPNEMYRTHTGCHIAMCLNCMENAKKAVRQKLQQDVYLIPFTHQNPRGDSLCSGDSLANLISFTHQNPRGDSLCSGDSLVNITQSISQLIHQDSPGDAQMADSPSPRSHA